MKKLVSVFVFSIAFNFLVFSCYASKKPLALVYTGPGSCVEGCSESAANVAVRAGFRVRYVTPAQIQPSILAKASLWVQPGGNAIDLVKALTPGKIALIRDFVGSGGNYLGFCAGAFFTDEFVDNEKTMPGLNITPGEQFDYIPNDATAYIVPIRWRGHKRELYFQEGGYFSLDPTRSSEITVLAEYLDRKPVSITFPYKNGRAAITGVHPEAPLSWKQKDNLYDPDGDDMDLADDLLKSILQ